LEQLSTAVVAAICYSESRQSDGEWIMKRYAMAISMLLVFAFGAVATGPAMAQHRGGHGFGHGGVRFGVSLGVPLYWPGYYAAPYYGYPYGYPPVYAYPAPAYGYPGPAVAPSSAYVEQGFTQAAPAPVQPQGDWYYCAESKTYYPYVRECPGGWQRVPAQPPR
jgi:hypothetical protein